MKTPRILQTLRLVFYITGKKLLLSIAIVNTYFFLIGQFDIHSSLNVIYAVIAIHLLIATIVQLAIEYKEQEIVKEIVKEYEKSEKERKEKEQEVNQILQAFNNKKYPFHKELVDKQNLEQMKDEYIKYQQGKYGKYGKHEDKPK